MAEVDLRLAGVVRQRRVSQMVALQPVMLVLQKSVPVLARQLPKLWPLLLDAKNRDKVASLIGDLASASPKRKLAGRMDLTELLAQRIAEQADSAEERKDAEAWQSRARKLRARLDMPVEGAKARRAHRADLRSDLAALHNEMSTALRD